MQLYTSMNVETHPMIYLFFFSPSFSIDQDECMYRLSSSLTTSCVIGLSLFMLDVGLGTGVKPKLDAPGKGRPGDAGVIR